MINRWSDEDAKTFLAQHRQFYEVDRSILAYASRLLGADRELVLFGGGNASVKGEYTDIFGERRRALYIKASGLDMATATPASFSALDLAALLRLSSLPALSEESLRNELRLRLTDASAPLPSIETLAHAFLPGRFILHTHPDVILVFSNQRGGLERLRAALGSETILLPYHKPGYCLAKASALAFESAKQATSMVWAKHGLVTWGQSAKEAYDRMIRLVSVAEECAMRFRNKISPPCCSQTLPEIAQARLTKIAPVIRGIFVRRGRDPDTRPGAIILPLVSRELLGAMDSDPMRNLLVSPPLTTDHLIRVKPFPAWLDPGSWDNRSALAAHVEQAIEQYEKDYQSYFARNNNNRQMLPYDSLPQVFLVRGAGALTIGSDLLSAQIARDITEQGVFAKLSIAQMGGTYESLAESDLFHMEYDAFQRAKLQSRQPLPMAGRTALVTGAAGAIGAGICEELLHLGCAVAAADVHPQRLQELVDEFRPIYGDHIAGCLLDVTERSQVAAVFDRIVSLWGGLDLLVINAGAAHVARLWDLDLESFRTLERVNVEGVLNMLAEAAIHFQAQNSGGDIVLISTKNVFAPGAGFGAYSASKAAAHQLARIASLEMAEFGVRVNMVAPDAVFSHGERRSGLWDKVGPERMRARGLNEAELEQYYQNRNLLKARITAKHVANAVMYFASRQTPTTGATIPVDGGLPDATPR